MAKLNELVDELKIAVVAAKNNDKPGRARASDMIQRIKELRWALHVRDDQLMKETKCSMDAYAK